MTLRVRSFVPVLVLGALVGCTPGDFPFEPPPFQIELPSGPVAHTFRYIPHADTPPITSIVVRGQFNDWSGDAMRMTLHDGVWSVTAALDPDTYEYKYVFNGDGWADDMCASATWGNPPGGRIDPDITQCAGGGNGLVEVDAGGLLAHTFRYQPHADTEEITSIVVRGQFNDWSGDAMRMTEHNGVWSVTRGFESGTYQYKYVFNGDQWADNMCASTRWGNPPGGRIDPAVENCDGENAILVRP
jgi:hypothetical protein